MDIVAAIYWAGVLFALGISISMAQSIADDNPIVELAILAVLCCVSLLSWVAAGILIGSILSSIPKERK